MIDVGLSLVSYTINSDEIGQEVKQEIIDDIPIIEQTSITHEEYYEANQYGLRPEIKFLISSLNYQGQTDLIYMGQKYSIIRTSSTNPDEIYLICEKKIGDIDEKSCNK